MNSEEQTFKQIIQEDLSNFTEVTMDYVKNPMFFVRTIPQWHWYTFIFLHLSLAGFCGGLTGIVEMSATRFFLGILFYPLSTLIVSLVSCTFLYYTFFLFLKIEIHFRQLFGLFVFSIPPFLVLHTTSSLVPFVDLLGFVATSILLIIGLVENFFLPRKFVIRLFIGLIAVFFILWGVQIIGPAHRNKSLRQKATPESMEILGKELSQ